MKVVGFVGSPRKNGNTDVLLQQVLEGASAAGAETKIFYLNELNFQGCQGCGFCKVNDKCRLKDDMTPLYDEIAKADAIVIGSPVYMFDISGQTKLFFDRWYAFLNPDFTSRLEKGKKVALVFAQGNPDSETFRKIFENMAGALKFGGQEVLEILVAAGVGKPGEVANDQELMHKAQVLGESLVKQ